MTTPESQASAHTHGFRGLDPKQLTTEQKIDLEQQMRSSKGDAYVDQLKAGTLYNGACPIDPFEKVMCTSCQ